MATNVGLTPNANTIKLRGGVILLTFFFACKRGQVSG
jgi:hypothetical protein